MERLVNSPVGRCVPIRGRDHRFREDYSTHAFLPDDLPQAVSLSADALMAVGDAREELGRLDGSAAIIASPQLITRMATRREAIGTSALEGTFANLTDLLAAEEEEADVILPANIREVMNYTRAADIANVWIQDRPITSQMLSTLQGILLKDTAEPGTVVGGVRDKQVFIGAGNRRIRDARFVPPPPGDQLFAMYEAWVRWLNEPALAIPLVARVAMAHYQFETVHPYSDGNGRIGRMVAVLQLISDGVLRSPVLSVSPWLKDNAEEYRSQLFAVSETGDWSPWVGFFARAVAAEARLGHDRIMDLLRLREELTELVRTARPKARLAVEITEEVIAYPIMSVSAAKRRHGRTDQANRNAIHQLVELGVLTPYSDATYNRLYWNRRVFEIVDRPV